MAHFEKSSDIVLHLLETTNVHVRSVLLGLSFQLSVAMSLTLLENRHRVGDFFDHFGRFWEANYAEGSDSWRQRYERSYQRMEATLTDRLALIEAAVEDPTGAGVTPLERNWITHCRELRDRIRALADGGQLALRPRAGADTVEVADRPSATDPWGPVAALLSSYVHMTNNRLGVSILDEVYLSHLAGRTIRDSTALDGRAA